ncbi:MAG: hypothetical protein HZC49_13425 [Nitrospirae bacterium]|nr:hypothetical protein [Nitrospirota bacterium]
MPIILVMLCALSSALVLLSACSGDDSVKEYFQSHEMTYPADVSGVELLGIRYIGIKREELASEGAREFVQEGIVFAKEYFMKEDVGSIMQGISAVIVNSPVLFRDESGAAGLMVTVTGFGTGAPDSKTGLQVERMGKDKHVWKVKNFAYFNRDEFYNWQFGGWVY